MELQADRVKSIVNKKYLFTLTYFYQLKTWMKCLTSLLGFLLISAFLFIINQSGIKWEGSVNIIMYQNMFQDSACICFSR